MLLKEMFILTLSQKNEDMRFKIEDMYVLNFQILLKGHGNHQIFVSTL